MTSIVSEGLLYMYSTGGQGFTLQAQGLVATLNLSDTGSFPILGSYDAGDSVNLSGNLAGDQTLHSGPAYYNTKSYSKLWYEGSLSFTATSFTLPPNSPDPVTVSTPFTFAGNLRSFESNNISGGGGPVVFDIAFSGKGRATAIFSVANSGTCPQNRCVQALLYYFTSSYGFSWRDLLLRRQLR